MKKHLPLIILALMTMTALNAATPRVYPSEIGAGWSATSVNSAVFRAASVVSHGDTQYAAYYDPEGWLVLAKRTLGSGGNADSTVPQYRLVWHDGNQWRSEQVGNRTAPFSLSGGGTKMIPIARPRLVSDGRRAFYIFRDAERGSRVSMAYTSRLGREPWQTIDLTDFSVDAWEPTIDNPLWAQRGRLDIFVQTTHQGDGESLGADSAPTPVQILTVEVPYSGHTAPED